MKIYTPYIKAVFLLFAFSALCSQPLKAQMGMFYGLTANGGADSGGAVITFNPADNTESTGWSFKHGDPVNGLVLCPVNGLLYGTTAGGGRNYDGSLFSYNTETDSEKVVWNFGGNGGISPYGNLVYNAGNGLFYGTTFVGGTVNNGIIFSFNQATDSLKALWDFGNGNDGALPYGNLVYDESNGLYYGMTYEGGATDGGVIYTFNPANDSEQVVYSFADGADGESPYGNLVYDPANSLFYGMTNAGGPDSTGVIFSFDPVSKAEHVVWSFGNGNDGANPYADLVYNSTTGLFYGTTQMGGTTGSGTIFSFNPTNNTENVLWNFGNVANDGQFPGGNLTYNPGNGLYYGMTQNGGTHTFGTIFSFNANSNAENVLWSLGGGFDGSEPQGSLFLLGGPSAIAAIKSNPLINIFPDPTNGMLTVNGLNAGQLLLVYNYLGQKVNSLTVEDATQQIDISEQSNGLYLVQIMNADGTLATEKKVMKIK